MTERAMTVLVNRFADSPWPQSSTHIAILPVQEPYRHPRVFVAES